MGASAVILRVLERNAPLRSGSVTQRRLTVETVILEPTNEVRFASRAVSDPAAFGPIYDHLR